VPVRLSPQSQKVYEVLLKEGGGLTIAEIAFKLRIAAGDVYRLAKPLLDIGLVERSIGRPFRLATRPNSNGLDIFLSVESRWFVNHFPQSKNSSGSNVPPGEMQLEFIQGRDELMRKSVFEIDQCTKSVDLLRSGHEIPTDTMRALAQAIKRRVKVRMLIQDYENENKDQVANWIKNGILVRKTAIKSLRLMIYDSNVGYFMSYKHSNSGQDMGMKIVYPPFAVILSNYFQELWKKSTVISNPTA
jgi:sugar-specific transcriptional regulator TrmB